MPLSEDKFQPLTLPADEPMSDGAHPDFGQLFAETVVSGWRRYAKSFAEHEPCRVYWGSHGCCLPRGHEAMGIDHFCECAWDDDGNRLPRDDEDEDGPFVNVGAPPHYGPDTSYYGEDAEVVPGAGRE